MGITPHEKIIDNHKVIVTSFGGRKGLQYKLRLVRLISPVFSGLFSGVSTSFKVSELMNLKLDTSSIGTALTKLLETADDDRVFALIMDLLSSTFVDGQDLKKETAFDHIFAEDYALLYKVLFFVLEANYGKLFNLGGIGSLMLEESKGPKISPENMRA